MLRGAVGGPTVIEPPPPTGGGGWGGAQERGWGGRGGEAACEEGGGSGWGGRRLGLGVGRRPRARLGPRPRCPGRRRHADRRRSSTCGTLDAKASDRGCPPHDVRPVVREHTGSRRAGELVTNPPRARPQIFVFASTRWRGTRHRRVRSLGPERRACRRTRFGRRHALDVHVVRLGAVPASGGRWVACAMSWVRRRGRSRGAALLRFDHPSTCSFVESPATRPLRH